MEHILYRIHGILYEVSDKNIEVGDLVLDTKDNTYGYISMEHDKDYVAVTDSPIAEVGVPKSRLKKLIPAIETNSIN